jgi:hypothetical protein
MGFLAPWFLAGVGLAGLPVWLHLLRQHMNVRLPFSSLMFFERRTESSVRRRRLKHLLLFALRLTLILLLPLLFANPYLKRVTPLTGQGEKLVVLAIDNSFSMRQDGQLERARQGALAVLSSTKPSDQCQVVAFASGLWLMTQPTRETAELRAAVAAIDPGDSASRFAELARGLRSIAQSAKVPVEAHVFSDFQKTSLPPSFADLQLGTGIRLVPHSTAAGVTPNWSVDNVTAPRRLAGGGRGKVQGTVSGHGTAESTRRVALLLDGRTLETKTVQVPASGRAVVEFLSLESPYGFHKGEVRLLDSDGFPDDDGFQFAVERGDPRRILFLGDNRGAGRAFLYYRNALESAAAAAFQVEEGAVERAGGLTPEKYAAVVLSDSGQLSASLEPELTGFVKAGGGLLVLLGPSLNARGAIPVTGGRLGGVNYAARGAERFQSIVSRDDAHPVLARTRGIEGVRFYQTVRAGAEKSRVLARLADGSPLLIEDQVGEGRVLTFASAFDNLANDFPLHPSFLAFVEQSARYLAHDEESASSYRVDSHLELRSSRERATSVEVIDPAGRRALTIEEAARAQTYRLPSRGFFELRRGSGRQSLVAVNADPRESVLEPAPAEALLLWQNTGQAAGSTGQGTETESERIWSLWWYLAVLLLCAVLAESVVSSRYFQRETAEIPVEQREAA